MEKIIINAENTQMGRIGSYAAKQALLGNEIIVLNSEKAVISGNKVPSLTKYRTRRQMGGSSLKGPKISKDTEKILKRCIRGMLPDHRTGRGKQAWKKIKCYNGIPAEYKEAKAIKITKKLPTKHITLKELKAKL